MPSTQTDTRQILSEADLANLTPELLDEWFPAWRQVAAEILALPITAATPTTAHPAQSRAE